MVRRVLQSLIVTSVQTVMKEVNFLIPSNEEISLIPDIDELEEKYSFSSKTKAELADEMLPIKEGDFTVGPDGYINNPITKELRKFAKKHQTSCQSNLLGY